MSSQPRPNPAGQGSRGDEFDLPEPSYRGEEKSIGIGCGPLWRYDTSALKHNR